MRTGISNSPACSQTSCIINASDGLALIDMTFERTAPWIANAIESHPRVQEDQIRTRNHYLSLHTDVWVGGHTWQYGQVAKFEAMNAHPGTDPFIGPQGYRELIAARSAEFVRRLGDPSAPGSRGRSPATALPRP